MRPKFFVTVLAVAFATPAFAQVDHAAVPVEAPPAPYPVPPAPVAAPPAVYPVPVAAPPAAYPVMVGDHKAAARAYKEMYRFHKRAYRQQRHAQRHLQASGVVFLAPGVPVPVPGYLPLPVPFVSVPIPIPVPVPVVAFAPVPAPVVYAAPPPAPVAPVAQVEAQPDLSRTLLGANVQAHPHGAVVGAAIVTEGKRLGLHLGASGVIARCDDGSSRLESLKLVEGHLTYAPISGSRGRVRLEGGVSAAFGPRTAAVGPDVGISGDLRLIGSLGVEGGARYAPFPHKRTETWAGAFLGLGALRLQGGWRSLWLDAAILEGMQSPDSLRGPYLGATLVF